MSKTPVPPAPASGLGQTLPWPAQGPHTWTAQAGKIYRLSPPSLPGKPAALVVLRKGKDLVVQTEGGSVTLQGFFDLPPNASVLEWTDPTAQTARIASGAGAGPGPIGSSAHEAWLNASAEWAHGASPGVELLYAQGPSPVLQQWALGHPEWGWSGTAWPATVSGAEAAGFWWPQDGWQWLSGSFGAGAQSAAGVGLLTLPLLLQGGAAAATVAAANAVLKGLIVAGPVIAGNDLVVRLYSAQGQLLDTAQVDAQGQFELNAGSYRGNVLVQMGNSGSAALDYWDEGTGTSRNLDTPLRAMLTIDKSGQYIFNLNALTELAVRSAGVSGHQLGSLGASALQAANAQVAKTLGLTDLMADTPVAIVKADGSSNVNLANAYGWLLAAIAGAEESPGMGTTDAVLQALQTALQNNNALLPTLLEGVWNLSGAVDTLPYKLRGIEVLSGQTPQGIQHNALSFDPVAGNNHIDPTEQTQAITLSGQCAPGSQVTVLLGGTSHAASVAGAHWSLTLQATDWHALAQGPYVVEVSATLGQPTRHHLAAGVDALLHRLGQIKRRRGRGKALGIDEQVDVALVQAAGQADGRIAAFLALGLDFENRRLEEQRLDQPAQLPVAHPDAHTPAHDGFQQGQQGAVPMKLFRLHGRDS